jgi:CRP-like cAMP-binding protein
MFSPLLPSALDARTQAFPVLTARQIDRIRSCSRSRPVAAGDILFEPGDENVPFYALLSGEMEIVQPDLAGEHLIARHGPGQFTGEITMISGRRCLSRGRVTELARRLSSHKAESLGYIKRLVRIATEMPLAQELALERNLFLKLCVSDQALARIRSYEERKITTPSRSIET